MMTDDSVGCEFIHALDPVASLSPRHRRPLERIADALEQLAQNQPLMIYEAGSVAVARLPSHDSTDRTYDSSHARVRSCAPLLGGGPSVAAGSPSDLAPNDTAQMKAELAEIKAMLKQQQQLIQPVEKQYYTVDEVAELTGHRPWTIRQACNRGRVKGKKGDDGRWRVAHEQLVFLQENGLPAE
jgi:hypothetical protein